MHTEAEIVIVGGGPAGSRFARRAVDEGIPPDNILLLDRAQFPRQKLCGGGITYRGTRMLADIVGRPPAGGTTYGLSFESTYGVWRTREPGTQWLYDRAALDTWLLDQAVDAGIHVHEQTTVKQFARRNNGWHVTTNRGTVDCRWLIGADGAGGMTRRNSGLPGGWTGRLVEAVFEAERGAWDEHLLVVDFDPVLDGIPGYAWIFPYPKPGVDGSLWKIGIMDGRGKVPGSELRRWTADYAARKGFRMLDSRIAGWPEHYFHPRSKAHRPGMLLIGEAWGIDPLLGEGIAPSLAMADYAARRLASARRRNRNRIIGFEKGFLATAEGYNLWLQKLVSDRIYGRNGDEWLRFLYSVDAWRRLLRSGRAAYGRLAMHTPRVALPFVREAIRHRWHNPRQASPRSGA